MVIPCPDACVKCGDQRNQEDKDLHHDVGMYDELN